MTAKKYVLFICVENSNRSQMAEAFTRHHGSDYVDAHSAGSRPSGIVNPKAIAAMREKGLDLTTHSSKGLNQIPDVQWEWAITMGCGDECPLLHASNRDDWALPDPKHLPPNEFNTVRDEIERRVFQLLDKIRIEVRHENIR